VSTEWHYFAFDEPAFRACVYEPVARAIEARDAEAWTGLLARLEDVHPPSRLSHSGFAGAPRGITDVEWYGGAEPLPIVDTPSSIDDHSVQVLLKLALESLATYRVHGKSLRPRGAFWELGLPESIESEADRQAFSKLAGPFFGGTVPMPAPYGYLERVNQGVGLALPPAVSDMVAFERTVGFLPRLVASLQSTEWADVALDLQSLWFFLCLANNDGLAVYYREDAT